MRTNELISGACSDVAVKIYGDDLDKLAKLGTQMARLVQQVSGAADVKVEQVTGLPVLTITPDAAALARYGLNPGDVQETVSTAIGGKWPDSCLRATAVSTWWCACQNTCDKTRRCLRTCRFRCLRWRTGMNPPA